MVQAQQLREGDMERSGQAMLPAVALHPKRNLHWGSDERSSTALPGELKQPRDTANSASCFRRAKAWAPNVTPSSIVKGTNTWPPHTCWTPDAKTSCRCTRTTSDPALPYVLSCDQRPTGYSTTVLYCRADYLYSTVLVRVQVM